MEYYTKGQTVTATVEQIFPFGVFVRLEDGQRAYIRRRELSLAGDAEPAVVLAAGQEIPAVVLETAGQGTLAELSLRATLPDPWLVFAPHHRVGDTVAITIKSLFPDGVFAQITPGVDGFIPLQDLATWPVQKPEDVVWTNDRSEAVITHLDAAQKRVYLSVRVRLRQLSRVQEVMEHIYGQEAVIHQPSLFRGEEADKGSAGDFELSISLAQPILVVEDNDAVRGPLVNWLAAHDCKVDGACDAREAQDYIGHNKYALILVDLDMPDTDGVTFIARLRRQGLTVPVAAMSGPEMIEHHLTVLEELRVAAVLPKPLDRDELLQLLGEIARGESRLTMLDASGTVASQAVANLYAHAAAIRTPGPTSDRLQRALRQIVQDTRAEMGLIFCLQTSPYRVTIVEETGDQPLNRHALYGLTSSPVRDVIRDHSVVHERHAATENEGKFRKLLDVLPFESCIGVPLYTGVQVQHALFLFHRNAEVFSIYHVRDALATGNLISAVLENQALETRLDSVVSVLVSGHLAAGFGHEVYNKVSGLELQVANVIYALGRATSGGTPQDTATQLQKVVESLAETERIVTDFKKTVVDFQGLMRRDSAESIDINQNVQQAELQAHPLALRAHIKTQFELAAETPLVVGSPTRLQQVLLNLMLNAIQQMETKPAAHHRLTIGTRCEADHDGQWVCIRVSDSGPGIHQQQIDQVFDLGFTTRPTGSGLGLYIARRIIESMGGDIEVEDTLVPFGTTFRIRLPRLEQGHSREGNDL